MKFIAILCLILAFWCHQTHHQIFMLINTSPLSLASEEFIPLNEAPTESENKVAGEPQSHDEGVTGSQSERKSDNEPEAGLKLPNEDAPGPAVAEIDKVTVVNKKLGHAELDQPIAAIAPPKEYDSNAGGTEKPPVLSTIGVEVKKETPLESVDVPATPANESTVASESDLKPGADDERIINSSSSPASSDQPAESQSLEKAADGGVSATLKSDAPQIPETSTPAPSKEEEPIPSFMEWTQLQHQKLQETNLAHGGPGSGGQIPGQNGHQKGTHNGNSQHNKSTHTTTPVVGTKSRKEKESTAKNFASPDCGAKVIQSNPESQNANGVLSSSHDEYMLNKCGVPIWFIIELCEPLKIEKVSLGNLELFSSSPKDIEIGISDRYPTRDWTKLGPFTLPDIRDIHSIDFPSTNASTFGKFLKVNVLSHYGTEHFCPLSLVRVNGISEYEVLESENTHPGDMDESEKEENALFEEPVIDQQTVEGSVAADKSVFGSAKDAVINIVKKAAQVLVKSDNSKDNSQQPGASLKQTECRSLLQCLPDYEDKIKDRVLSLLSCNFSNLLPFLSKNSPWCGWDYCHALFNKHSIGLPWQPEGFYASIFGGPTVLFALCNYHRPLTKESCNALFLSNNMSATSSDDNIFGDGYINDSLKSPPVSFGTTPADVTEAKEKPADDDSNIPPSGKASDQVNGTASTTESSVIKDKVIEPEPVDQVSISEPAAGGSANGESVQPTPSQPPAQWSTMDETTTTTPSTTPNSNSHQTTNPGQQQQKESVFVRLSNRIKTLERNQSLTVSYLEELSRRFKKQNEENAHTNEGTKNFMNESRNKFKVIEDLYRFELRSLRRNTDEIRERLFNVQLQRSLLIVLCLLQFLGIVSVCIWVRKRFRQFESRLENVESRSTSQSLVPVSNAFIGTRHGSPQHILAGRKRMNSEGGTGSGLSCIDKSKKIKKKKKKLADLKPVNVKSSPGPSSAPIDYQSCKSEREFRFQYPTPITSSLSAYNIPVTASSNFKENIKPEPQSSMNFTPYTRSGSPPSAPMTPLAPNVGINSNDLLSTQVDSPFAMISSTSANFFVEPGVSTSSRFALLASPGPPLTTKTSVLKRSGSLTSLESSSTSSYGTTKTGSNSHNSVMNGHDDSQTVNGSGKKRKNKGLKAFMPKIFDR